MCVGGGFTINGTVDISGNTKNNGTTANNVFIHNGAKITIESGFNTTSPIGVNTATTPNCTKFVDVTGETTSDISASFTADIDGQSIVYKDDKVQLEGAHDWGEWEITTEPSETDKGEATRNCTITEEHTDTKELPELTDTEVWEKATTEPTCTDGGSDVYKSEYGTVTIPSIPRQRMRPAPMTAISSIGTAQTAIHISATRIARPR